ncbi:SET domain-containing protein [Piromyces finnis]|uniref:SET domain-containing protein n=1 Tax=Piromyces finnis TaxID=1754191 RepID=A0A1Y1VEM0_9FUNG|nr:SET domain-containing protein [Piromyces finnis]|eukprot:ORX54295.1 SET domain-containing protein [Piromyces finnis]
MAKEEKVESKKTEKKGLSLGVKIAILIVLLIPTACLIIGINNEEKLNKQLWKDIEAKYYELGFDKLAKEEATNSSTETKEVPKEKAPIENNRFRKFRQDEISKYFTVDLIHEIEPESYFMKRALKDYEIENDEKMKEHPEEYKVNSVMYGKYFEKDYFKNDDRFYIQFVDQHKGFGLFASKSIKQNDVIGIYTGLISMELGKKLFDSRYLFHITSVKHPYTGAKADLYIDARVAGNQLRFVNHDPNPNCEAIYVPHDNMWNVIFVAKRDIQVNEEITISYGKSFKSVRGKEIEVKEEESGPDDYMDTEWDIKRKEELEARDPNTGKLLKPHLPNKYELEDQKRKILRRMKNSGF